MMILKAFYVLVIFLLMIQLAFLPSNGVESHAELYWKNKVGNMPMPKTLKDSLQLGSDDGIVKLNPNYVHNFANDEDKYFMYTHPVPNDQLFMKRKGLVKISQIPQDGRLVFLTYDALSRAGTKLKLHFQKIDNEAKFLPFQVTKSMPTSFDKRQIILNLFSVNPKSISAQDIEITLKTCEEKGVKDEKRYCATSLEGMIDYVTSILNFGKSNLTAVSTEQDNDIYMEYTIRKVQNLGSNNDRNVVCHKMSNPYVVFLCHYIKNTYLYSVTLVDANKKQTKVVVVCHKDTSSWNPRTYALVFLNSKPGGEPICHFISANTVVWFQN